MFVKTQSNDLAGGSSGENLEMKDCHCTVADVSSFHFAVYSTTTTFDGSKKMCMQNNKQSTQIVYFRCQCEYNFCISSHLAVKLLCHKFGFG